MTTALPLAVDLDGTLARTDTLYEAVATAVLRQPWSVPALIRALLAGRASLKHALASQGAYRAETVPLNAEFLDYLRQEKARGRPLHLVTASPQPVADAVAERTGVFDSAAGTTNDVNLRGAAKAQHLRERFPDGFAYAGNDQSDLEVWRHARSAVTVAAPAEVERAVDGLGIPVEQRFASPVLRFPVWLRMLRIHQWSKNLLMFIPLVLAHLYSNVGAILDVVAGFVCMGLVASATYIVNDLSDLHADRRHATKCRRPLAAGEIAAGEAVVVALLLGLTGLVGAAFVEPWFGAAVLGYVLLTTAYSLHLKTQPLVDVFTLGVLYTLRIVMGTILLGIAASPWLLVFSLFFFFSMSTAKRHVEIVRASRKAPGQPINGRGYTSNDAPLTLALGVAANAVAVMLLFLYVANDAYPMHAYDHPAWLWGISPIVFLWSTRIWLKSHRGELDDDPIEFALRDRPSYALGLAAMACIIMAVR
jgi:4-hydroxybenzoate polyprenyltransferase/phosphoserine phosphatase